MQETFIGFDNKNKDMFAELITLAVSKGWNLYDIKNKEWWVEFFKTDQERYSLWIPTENIGQEIEYTSNDILFNHSFAQAVFGRQWSFYLGQLAVTTEEDRIAYAYQNRVQTHIN